MVAESASLQRDLPDGPGVRVKGAWSFIKRPRQFYAWARRRYGEAVLLSSGDVPIVMLLTSGGAREVLTANPENYDALHKIPFTGLTGPGSLWVLDGARHRHERLLLSPRFSAHRVREYGEAIKQIALRHVESWQPNQRIRAYEAMLGVSRDVILLIVFDLKQGPGKEMGDAALKRLLHSFHPALSLDPMFQSWWFPPWYRYRRAKRQFHRFVEYCLAERRAAGIDGSDILGTMLAARDADGGKLSDDHIKDELITLLLAGHETTAVALSWALYELARNPATLERLQQELHMLGPDPQPDQISKLPYLGAVCDETLRLHSILTEIGRVARTTCRFSGYVTRSGAGVAVGIGAIHQDPSIYPEPLKFRPERFLERNYSAFEFLPFGGSHRRCLGAHLSDYEMRIVLGIVVMHWEFEATRADVDVRHNIGTGPKHGVPMRLGRRRSSLQTVPVH
jgi:cytochrome P450